MPNSRRADALCALGLACAGALVAWLGWQGKAGQPTLHDEFAELFQARTLLAGHLSFPSPPLPEFFEAAHILVTPVYAAKYFPGHALFLTPLLALSAPWLWSSVALGAAAALLFLALRAASFERFAAACAALVFACSGKALPVWSSYHSHTSSALLTCAALAAAARFHRRPSTGAAALLATCAGGALLVRPFVGVALAASGLIALLLTQVRRARFLPAYAAPLAAAAVAGSLYSHAITGSFTTAPWSLYARQYTPSDGPGIGPPAPTVAERDLPAHLRPLGDSFARSRAAYTVPALPAHAVRDLEDLAAFAPTVLVVALAMGGALACSARLVVPLAFALLLYLLQLTFHFRTTLYLFEAWPAVALAAGAGASSAAERVRRLQRPELRRLLSAALVLGGVWTCAACAEAVADALPKGATEALWLSRVQRRLEEPRRRRGLVFVHYPQSWSRLVELSQEEPDLDRARLVLALDLGPRNAELARHFSDRPAWVFDVASGQLTPLLER